MYYRYKVNKSNFSFVKYFFVLGIIIAMIFIGYKYRQYLLFWKYTDAILLKRINNAHVISDTKKKRNILFDLSKDLNKFKKENQLQANAFFLSGSSQFYLAESFLAGSFSELVINDSFEMINSESKKHFQNAIRDIKKGLVLLNGNNVDPAYMLILARACYFSRYYEIDEINKMIEKFNEINNPSVEEKRFYSVIKIKSQNEDFGLKYLIENGEVVKTVQGKLFLAASQKIAKKYTDSIINYKKVLSETSDQNIKKLIYKNLGSIYFTQRLYKESLELLMKALEIDQLDNEIRIWIGKNYHALGDKDKARLIWTDILKSDKTNSEVKNLLSYL